LPTVRNAAASRPRTICARSTNDPRFVDGTDGRSKLMRRRRDLMAIFVEALGGEIAVSAALMLSVRRAADAVSLAEEYRARALRGEQVVLDDLVRLENVAARVVRALGIKPGAEHKAPSLAEHLARKYGGGAT
jgi:hypothetical protein